MTLFSKLSALFKKKRHDISEIAITSKPNHVAVIMDGNGRWANQRGYSRIAGHKKGKDAVTKLLKSAIEHDVRYISIFAFSSENWSRPKEEVSALMELLTNALKTQTQKLNEHGIRLQIVGDLSKLDEKTHSLARQVMQATQHNNQLVFTVAINYGGRWDITQACRLIAEQAVANGIPPADIDERLITQYLVTSDTPDPDLIIRTSGEQRLSNFFLWQSAYAELYFSDVLWPDFDEQVFAKALQAYSKRQRRFGNATDNIE